jgi:hypothetical protein
VIGAPVPTDDGNAVNDWICNDAGICTVTKLLLASEEVTAASEFPSVPVAVAWNVRFPVPCAEYVQRKVWLAFFANVNGVWLLGDTSVKPPVPTWLIAPGSTFTASASPVLVTVMSRYAACCRFTVVGNTVNDALRLAGLLTAMNDDVTGVDANTVAPEFMSVPVAKD